jgi:DNA-binding LacI/PurR family transcriptional regulator
VAERRPTLRSVAEVAGVSAMTVSNAYNRPELLSPETRRHVLRTAAALKYPGPNPAGRSLRLGRSDTVGLVLPERLVDAFADPGMLSFMRGLTSELTRASQALLLIPLEDDRTYPLIKTSIVDALILSSLTRDDPAIALARMRTIPFVTIGSPKLRSVPFVGVDDKRGVELAARHLLDLGHQRFGVIGLNASRAESGLPNRNYMQVRAEHFAQTVLQAGIKPEHVTTLYTDANDRASGRRLASHLLEQGPRARPSALFAVTDILALGALSEAASRGIPVPRGLSVVGFDDVPEAAAGDPALTTIAYELFQQGQAAAVAALAVGRGEKAPPVSLAPRLVVRQSSGPA